MKIMRVGVDFIGGGSQPSRLKILCRACRITLEVIDK